MAMDRSDSGLIKWSPNAAHDSFFHINLQHRVVQLYEPTGLAQPGRFEYRKLAKHDDLPPLTTYDWSPTVPGLVAVGTSTGVVNLLRVDDNSNAYLELGLRLSRVCQAVAFNTAGKLAVALDRVRNDTCLHIWDVSRLSGTDATVSGFPTDIELPSDPVDRLELNASVSSVRFFEDNPNVLVAGIKGQGLRIHDLRDQGQGPVAQFQTKCCNNLAIDYADQNYFASSALDQPGVMVWDRRAISRHSVSPSYTDALEQDGLPWGGALRLDRAVQTEAYPVESKNSFIRALRFSRDQAGMLAVLSRTGQLRVLSTRHEHVDADARVDGSPELLEVIRSYEMDPVYAEPNRKNDKIVSFDWITMSSPVLQPRVLVLRASGAFDVLQKPSYTSEYPFQLVPWQPPHRGRADGTDYQELMTFEPSQARDIFGPLLTEQALSDIPVFGPQKVNIKSLVEKALTSSLSEDRLVAEVSKGSHSSVLFEGASSIADKLKALRLASKQGKDEPDEALLSQLERHEKLLADTRDMAHLSSKERFAVDHTMLIRAQEGYRFDFTKNQKIVADDPWLHDVWVWVAGAEGAAADGGMMSHPLDIGYMGVHTVWTNDLGSKPQMRLSENASPPDDVGWERCLNTINKKLGIPKLDGVVETKRRHHREMCLELCVLGRSFREDFMQSLSSSSPRRESTWYTMVAAHAIFRGDTKGAVQVLKKASSEHPELLFVSLALQLIGKAGDDETKTALDFDERVACKTDPYLRAISAIIATGDWAAIADQKSLPLRDRCFVAVRYFSDDALTDWLDREVSAAIETGDIEGIILTGITDSLVDILARYVQKFNDTQTATLLLSTCAPRFIDDIRTNAMRNAYRFYLQRHRAFFFRAKFDVESTLRSKHHGRPTVPPPARQIGLRCVYCDVEFKTESLPVRGPTNGGVVLSTRGGSGIPSFMTAAAAAAAAAASTTSTTSTTTTTTNPTPRTEARAHQQHDANPYTEKMVASGISCPHCKQHLPRCVVCLEVVGMPRSDRPEQSRDPEVRRTARFPTFCVACGHVLHLDHARQWFARHRECPVPECRCLCNTRVNEELDYA
ncbi:SEH-associated protein 4 [Chaetomidium leptoderma]|uniref:SEH-associated protein 4 n=1 Tax=Chaetomidium leptoderma TaxID=669021 RepID=A0AAN6VSZ2_9PEZI|nr:SEH-associated protein 4 [Chaetomidium leptoderma]